MPLARGMLPSVSPASYHSVPELLDMFVPLLLTRGRRLLNALEDASYIPSLCPSDRSELTLDRASNMASPEPLGVSELSLKYCCEERASCMAVPDALPVPEPPLLSRCMEAVLREPDLASRNPTMSPAESTELRLLERGLALPVT